MQPSSLSEATFDVEAALKEKGLILPEAAKPVAKYVPYVVVDSTVTISGQLPFGEEDLMPYVGCLGENISVETAQHAAQLCALNILAQLKDACQGDFSRVRQCVKLGVFVNSAPDFTDQPLVANAASNLMVDVFGATVGSHARSAVGVNQLPMGVCVEIDAVFAL